MPQKKVAILNIGKALLGASFTTLAAVGSTLAGMSGNPTSAALWAGLSALPGAGLTAYDFIAAQFPQLKSPEEDHFEIPAPNWWTSDLRSWQNLCTEIVDYFPNILQVMSELLSKDKNVKTTELVQQKFIEALTIQYLTWATDPQERRKVAITIAVPILQHMRRILEPIVRQIQQEEAFTDIRITAINSKEAVQILEEAVQILKEMRDAGKPHVLSDEEIGILCQQYCSTLYEQWKMLDFRGIQHVEQNRPLSIPLTEVFVCPDVLVGVPEYGTQEREEAQEQKDQSRKNPRKDWEDKQEQTSLEEHRTKKEKRITLQREELHIVLAKNRYLVILGDPGAGKSTLLRYLLLKLIQGYAEFIAAFPQLILQPFTIPLYIPLARYAEVWRSATPVGERSLEHFLSKYLQEEYLGLYTYLVMKQLEEGSVFVLLDGLDEIPDAPLRTQIVRQIERFTQTYSKNRFIVTSRIIGYKDAPLAAEYQPHTLADFTTNQIRAFTQRWCPAYERWVKATADSQHLQDAATKEASKLFQATQRNPGVKKLAVNPLLLTILALIQRQGVELPRHRVKLFELCTETLIETWVTARGQSLDFDSVEMFKMLRSLAFWMHEHPAVGAIPEEELLERIATQLIQRNTNEYEATKIANRFLHTIQSRMGILVERGKQRYGFLHQTLEEYFAARELLVRKKEREAFIKEYLHEPRWREVILLAIGTLGILQKDEDEATELVQNAIIQAGSPFEEWLHRDLLFAGLCLGDDVRLNTADENNIIEQIVYLYLTSPFDSLRKAFSDVLSTWSGTRAGIKATNLIVSLLHKSAMLMHTTVSFSLTSPSSRFEDKIFLHFNHLIEQYKESRRKFVYLRVILILHHLRHEVSNAIKDSLEMLLDPLSDVREIAAFVLGQIGATNPDVVPALLKLLSDPDSHVREVAAMALGQLGATNPDVVPALLKILSDSDWPVQRAAVTALGQLGTTNPDVVPALLKLLSDPFSSIPKAAATALGQLGATNPDVVPALLKILSDSDSNARSAAIRTLGQLGVNHPNVVPALLNALSDSFSNVREAAATALGQLGATNPDVVPALLKTLSDSDSNARLAATRTLGQLGTDHPDVVPALLKALSDSFSNVREAAATALGQLGATNPDVVPALLKTLSDSDSNARLAATRTLGQLGTDHPDVVPALLKILSDPDSNARLAATRTLGQLGVNHPNVVPALLNALSDSSQDLQVAAATALGRLGVNHSDMVPALLKILSDSNSNARLAATRTLGQLGTSHPDVVPALLKALSDSSRDLQIAAATALGRLGTSHPDVVPALLQAFSDSSWHLRVAVATALGQLGATHPDVVPTLLEALSNSDSYVLRPRRKLWQVAIRALGRLGDNHPNDVVPALLQALSDSDFDIQQTAASALEQLGTNHPDIVRHLSAAVSNISNIVLPRDPIDRYVEEVSTTYTLRQITQLELAGGECPDAVPALLKVLSNSASNVRQAAASALGQRGATHPDVVPALLKTLSDPASNVQQAAASALGQRGATHPDVVPALLKTLSDPASNVQQAAASALGQVGTNHPDVVPALLKVLSNSASNVQQATWGIQQAVISALSQVGVPALLKALSESDPTVCEAAASALSRVGTNHSDMVPALLKILSDPVSNVRKAVASTLGQVGATHPDVVPALLKTLSDPASNVRQAAARALGQPGATHPDVVPALLKALSDADPAVQQAAAIALGQLGATHPDVVPALLKAFSDSHWPVQGAAAIALGQLGATHPDVAPALLNALSNADPDFQAGAWEFRQEVGTALGQLGATHPDVIVPALLKAFSDSDSDARPSFSTALDQLGATYPDVVMPALLKALSDDTDPNVRLGAVRTLGQVGANHPDVVLALLKTLSDSDSYVRQTAATALGQLGATHPDVVPALLNALSDSDSYVRQTAVSALGQLGATHPDVMPALLKTLSDSTSNVRRTAATALGQLGTNHPDVVPALLKTLSDSTSNVRRTAATALGQLGAIHPDVVPALLKTLSDSDSFVRQAAATALGQLGAIHPDVVPALLNALSDSDIRQTAASVLTTLQVNYVVIGQEIERLLLQSKPLTDRQIEADKTVDDLLSTLWQIIDGGV